MLKDVILTKDKDVRDKSFIEEGRIFIPTSLCKEELKRAMVAERNSGMVKPNEISDAEAVLLSMQAIPKKKKTIMELLRDGGR